MRIEISAGDFAKRDADGRVEMLAPLPCPFNYGFVPGTKGADGPRDAIVLGPPLPRGAEAAWRVRANILFVDDGNRDDKLVCSPAAISWWQRLALMQYLAAYAAVKDVRNRVGGGLGPTYRGRWTDLP